jgi:hypothetical protein
MLRLYMLSLQRSASLAQLETEEKHSLDALQTAYAEERERVEDEWKRGRDRVRERLVEGIEERRRRAREEKEGEGTVGGKSLLSCRIVVRFLIGHISTRFRLFVRRPVTTAHHPKAS